MPAVSALDAGAGDRRAEEDRMHQRPPVCAASASRKPAVRDGRLVLDVRGQERVVVVGQQLGQRAVNAASAGPYGVNAAPRVPRSCAAPIGMMAGVSLSAMLASTRSWSAPPRSILLTKMQRRDAQPLQRPHQHARLGLHALDGGDHQHGAVEHAQRPLDLGDEVRVAGRVDQVDGDVVDDERDDGGLDGDAALPFERQGIGLGAAVVDAADLVDDAGGVEQPLGQAGLTGVDMAPKSRGSRCARMVMSFARRADHHCRLDGHDLAHSSLLRCEVLSGV